MNKSSFEFSKVYPPHVLARLLISAASLTAVWSFHSTNMASGLFSYPCFMERGVPSLSTATGLIGSVNSNSTMLLPLQETIRQEHLLQIVQDLQYIKRVLTKLIDWWITEETFLPSWYSIRMSDNFTIVVSTTTERTESVHNQYYHKSFAIS